MKTLPNGCSFTELWVSPENWQTTTSKASLNKNWYVQCDYFDPLFKEKYPKGFPFRRKLNKFKTLEARKAAAALLLKEIPKLFEEAGFNPITKQYWIEPKTDEVNPGESELLPETPFLVALEFAKKSLKIAKSTDDDIRYMLDRIKKAAQALRFDELKIYDVSRKHIRNMFDYLENSEETFSAHKFNKYRGYLSSLYNELVEYEVVNGNIIQGIKKRVHEKQIREILSEPQRKLVNDHLKNNFPDFWRFTLIFFHSGGRITELLDLKTENVNLANQKYRILVKKGKQYIWVERIIKDIALLFWTKSMYNAKHGDYVFSKGLIPGPYRIRREQIGRRWNMHVKKKLNITADFYSLKHLNLDETSAMLSMADAAKMASHKSTKMIEQHYAVGETERQMQRLKTLHNEFA